MVMLKQFLDSEKVIKIKVITSLANFDWPLLMLMDVEMSEIYIWQNKAVDIKGKFTPKTGPAIFLLELRTISMLFPISSELQKKTSLTWKGVEAVVNINVT